MSISYRYGFKHFQQPKMPVKNYMTPEFGRVILPPIRKTSNKTRSMDFNMLRNQPVIFGHLKGLIFIKTNILKKRNIENSGTFV